MRNEEKEEEKIVEEENIEEVKSHKILNTFIVFVILCVLLVLYASYFGTKGLRVREYMLESNILSTNYNGIKIVHFSDLLYKSTVDKKMVKNMVDKIKELRPDIVVFTGNLVTNESKITVDDTTFLINELNEIDSSIGKYYIYGDLDFSYNDYDMVMQKSNFKLLNNSYDEIIYKTEDPLYIVGLPSSIKESVDLDESFKFYNELDRHYIIVLVNDGNTIKYLNESTYEVDLILGGYSLNGSVRLPLYGGLFKDKNSYKYYDEEYTKGITKIFISGGLGTRKYRYRLNNKPSFNLYRLKSQS